MSQKKYMMSGGLAFSEDKDMEKLRQLSLKGWHVSDFKFMGYTLEKGESSEYIYSIDYRSLKEDEKEEYFDFFEASGWGHIASQGDIHLFRAQPGTTPIYSDRDTTIDKYVNSNDSMKRLTIPIVILTVLLWIGAMVSTGTFASVLLVIASILSIFAFPAAWTLLATYNNKWKAKGEKGFVYLLKTLYFLLIIALFLLIFYGSDHVIGLFASMIFGAVALPFAIWVFMFLYHKLRV
ncbi:DUF2812 domain-containing protein [Bacillus tuaregi]|uniref:DUF2812 domain-containing protein n=1 Tax=Bacillus tuaregi TaxID=1816695 RepID=UPI0008F96225|nr:DUF2812 domain-containing protein [Bacillus tuaregi]